MIMIVKQPNPPRRPAVAFRVSVWHGNVAAKDRSPGTLCHGAIFRNPSDVIGYQKRVVSSGGAVHRVQRVVNPRAWFDSLEQFERLGSMSGDELKELKARWALAVDADCEGVEIIGGLTH